MITRKFIKIIQNIVPVFKITSSEGYYIKNKNTGKLYKVATATIKHSYDYEETDILIPVEEEKKIEETINKE